MEFLILLSMGKLYSDLFNKRQEGDYQDFHSFSKEEIEPLIQKTEHFINKIYEFINNN